MPIMRQRPPVHSVATVSAVSGPTTVSVVHDGQTVAVTATAQYVGPAVGDRVLTLILGRTVYATGLAI